MNSAQKCLVVFGGFISYFLADGYTFSVGVFYSYLMNKFDMNSSSAAVLPGLLYAIPQLTALFLCPLLETFGYSSGAAWGALLLTLSCVASAFVPSMELLYFTLGVLSSIGLQLTYSSAIMTVTATFRNSNLFGLVLGLTMCGSGIGSFTSSPLVACLLYTWTWRGAMIIQSAILLNGCVSAACFHHVDAHRFHPKRLYFAEADIGTESYTSAQYDSKSVSNIRVDVAYSGISKVISEQSSKMLQDPTIDQHIVNRCWPLLRYTICIPARFRFSVNPFVSNESTGFQPDPEPLCERQQTNHLTLYGCAELNRAFSASFHQMTSYMIWKNRALLTFLVANGLIGAAVVVPWTFIYDYALVSLDRPGGLDPQSVKQVAWLPSLIGIGSLCGQITVGLLTSQFGKIPFSRCLKNDRASTSHGCLYSLFFHLRSQCRNQRCYHLQLFAVAAVWNSIIVLLIAFLPISNFHLHASATQTFFDWPLGRVLCCACLFLGFSFGTFYVLYPQILLDLVGEELWASSLGVFLASNGVMNLVGTSVGGYIYDITGSYHGAFLFASCVSLGSAMIVLFQLCLVEGQPTQKDCIESHVQDA